MFLALLKQDCEATIVLSNDSGPILLEGLLCVYRLWQ